jgi:hypothetical protein
VILLSLSSNNFFNLRFGDINTEWRYDWYDGDNSNIKEEKIMAKFLEDMFPKTTEYKLVKAQLGGRLDNPLMKILLKDKKDEILALAKELKKEEE